MSPRASGLGSLARYLPVETAQGNGKGLHGAQGIAIVHGEYILGGAAELHDNILWIRVVHQLKVLHRCLRDTTMKVEHIRLCLIVPHGRLVVQLHNVVHVLREKRERERERRISCLH